MSFLASVMVACSLFSPTRAFLAPSSSPQQQIRRPAPTTLRSSPGGSFGGDGSGGGIEEIEFRIYPDGRVTEVVRGVKGSSCEKVTESINKALGNVVHSVPTEEMFEQELVVDQTVEQKLGGGESWNGPSSW
jgi:hypothetical protein